MYLTCFNHARMNIEQVKFVQGIQIAKFFVKTILLVLSATSLDQEDFFPIFSILCLIFFVKVLWSIFYFIWCWFHETIQCDDIFYDFTAGILMTSYLCQYATFFVSFSATEDVYIAERLFSSSLVAIVSHSAPRKLKVCHFKKGTEICNYSYTSKILAVKMNRAVSEYCLFPNKSVAMTNLTKLSFRDWWFA